MKSNCLSNLIADCVDRIQRRHRVLKYHRDAVSSHDPHLLLVNMEQVFAFKADLSAFNTTCRFRQKAKNTQRCCRLASAGLADETECFSLFDLKADTVDSLHNLYVSFISNPKILNLQNRAFFIFHYSSPPVAYLMTSNAGPTHRADHRR